MNETLHNKSRKYANQRETKAADGDLYGGYKDEMIDAFEVGYKAAFEDITDFIHERIDHYIEYDMQFPYIDDERMFKDLCNELLDVDFDY